MAPHPMYTTLNVPTVTSYPSIKCLQWSADGQACFTTKTAAYIMTPDHGINLDLVSAIKSTKETRDGIPPIAWFRTIIPFDKSDVQRWPEYSQAWGSASLGSIDVALWDVAFSPSSLSPDSCCILAALTSNMDLTLWTASKNCVKGEWLKIFDVTLFLLEMLPADDSANGMTSRVLKAQITSICWSQQVDFGFVPPPPIDGSLLVVGSRAGFLTFLRYQPDQTIRHIQSVSVADTWITHISISSWAPVAPGACEAHISYATSDGSVRLLKIKQVLHDSLDPSLAGVHFEIVATLDDVITPVCEPDNAGITALSWNEVPDKGRILAYCKPGTLHLFCFSHPTMAWSGHRSFRLKTIKLSAGSSSFHPPSGIQYIRSLDIFILTLFDGSFCVIHNVSTDPSMTPPSAESPVTSESLSMAVRNVFIQTEQGVEFADMNRITGLAPYDGSATLIWVQEASRPSDFSYKHDAKHSSMLVVSRIWDDPSDEAILQDLARAINGVKTVAGFAPLHRLRPFFFWLGDKHRLARMHYPLLHLLKPEVGDHSLHVTAPRFAALTPDVRRAFRASLSQHLFGWDVLLSLRLRLSLADFAWKNADNEDLRNDSGNVAQTLLTTISHRVLRTIIRHLTAAVDILTPNDVPFVFRMVVQSFLEGSPPDLSAEGNNLSTIARAVVFPGEQPALVNNSFSERCPACQVEVQLQDITTAVCFNGHTWARCSITTFILSTPLVRTCVGCCRKAFLPLSTPNTPSENWLPVAAQGWVVEELLEAVHRCLFCNNSFIIVL